MTGWRPALLIARRSVRRTLGRSLLIAALVALPVAGATMVAVVVRTLSAPERDAQRAMGSADARLVVTGMKRLSGWTPAPASGVPVDGRQRDPGSVDVAALLPLGTRVIAEPHSGPVTLTGKRIVHTQVLVTNVLEPLLRHKAELVEGRAPARRDEVLLSPALADRLQLRPGMTIAPRGSPILTVTGLAREPYCLSCELVVAPPQSALARLVPADGSPPTFLVDLPSGVSADGLWRELALKGIALTPRDAYLHPSRYQPDGGRTPTLTAVRGAALAAVVAGLGLLEVVLLAGTAFAVGARRQTRELGLVAASGGDARHIRRIVLAQGLVLGAIGAAAGVVAGAALAVAGRPLWERFDNAEIASWAFGPWEIAGAALLGLLSGLAAAVIPAIGAGRMRPLDALAERFRTTRAARRRSATAGLVLVLAGIACGLAGDRLLAGDFAQYARELAHVRETGMYVSKPTPSGPIALIVGGAALLVAGLLVLAPATVGRLSGTGKRLPVSLRLAVRDAARHRHRTGPAISAIAVAVAGSVVLAFLLAGSYRADELRYVPAVPPHVLAVDPDVESVATVRRAAAEAAAALPGGRAYELRQPMRPLAQGEQIPPGSTDAQIREMYPIPPAGACEMGCAGAGPLAIAGAPELNAIAAGGALDPAARRALAAGELVVFDRSLLWPDGRIAVGTSPDGRRPVRLTAHLAERHTSYSSLPSALVPEAVARVHGWQTATRRMFVAFDARATRDQVEAAQYAAEDLGVMAYADSGPGTPSEGILLALVAIAGLVTLAGVAISVALSAAEGRADLATLAAVGAPPRRRRALVAGQALLIAGLGSAAGLAAGAFVAFTARATTGSPDFVVPWLNLAEAGLAVPLLAVLVATAFTPSRLPLVRRAT